MVCLQFTKLYNHHLNHIWNIFITPKRNPIPINSHPPIPPQLQPPPQLLATTNLLSVSIDFPIRKFHINGIKQYVVLCVWLLSLDMMFSRFIQLVACVSASFLFMAE